jgi:hypothetical protein
MENIWNYKYKKNDEKIDIKSKNGTEVSKSRANKIVWR